MKRLSFLLCALFVALVTCAQNRVISGVVTNENKQPIQGAYIRVKGDTVCVKTDSSGKYNIADSLKNIVLIFSYNGLDWQVAIDSLPNVNVVLSQPAPLKQKIVTALGIEKEPERLGYAIQKVDGAELQHTGEQNIIEALSAKVAGIDVVSSAGTPGASSRIIIRGPSTFLNNNQPLIVLDGMPIDNSTTATRSADYPFDINLEGVNNANRALDIDPDDIESVVVLKGPEAATLYGVRAGAGALLITTKKGNFKGDHKVHVTVSSSVEFDKVNKLPALQNKYAQGENGVYEEANPGADGIFGTADDISNGTPFSWGPRIDSLGKGTNSKYLPRAPYNNYKDFFKTGAGFSNNISISGGNDKTSTLFTFSDLKQNGVIPNTGLNRVSTRLNTEMKVTDRLTFTANVSYVNTASSMAQNGSNAAGIMLGLTQAPASYDLIGNTDSSTHQPYKYASGQQRQYYVGYDNPYWSAYNNTFTSEVNRLIGNFLTSYKLTNWFDMSYRLGADFYVDQRKEVYALGSQQPLQGPSGEIEEDELRHNELYGDLLLNFHHSLFLDGLSGILTLGNNFDRMDNKDLYSRGTYLYQPDFFNLSNAATLYSDEANSTIKTAALFFDATLNYKNFLFVNVIGRNEWSSAFSQQKDNFFYPAVNLSWVVSELLPKNKFLTLAKIRGAYAQAGISPQPYLSGTYFTSPKFTDPYINDINFPYLGQPALGYNGLNSLGNMNIKPETNTGYETGIDLRFFRDRISFNFTYYYQKTTDILVPESIAPSSGFQTYLNNSGAMSNKGVELTLGADIIKAKNSFVWNVTANFSRNHNEVLQLGDGITQLNIENAFTNIGAYAIVGQPYGELYGTKWERTNTGQLIINAATGLPIVSPTPGSLGNPYPDWQMGLRNTFSFKGISISLLFDFRHGGDVWNGTIAHLNSIGMSAASANRAQNYLINGVVQTGTNTDGSPIYSANSKQVSAYDYFNTYLGDGDGSATENAVFDGGWIRLREITLSYHFDFKRKKVLIKTLDVFATGRNLWLHTNYPGVDPETSLTGAGSNIAGFDYFNMPGTKSYIVGFKAGF